MIEISATIIITVSSMLLFGYWFRYTCLLILSAKTSHDYAADVATANQLGFVEIQSRLREGVALDGMSAALDRDYAVIRSLLEQAASAGSIEDRMLQVNYRISRAWYACSRQFAPNAARKALEEMCLMVAHFANSMGERAAAASAA
jgi:hypothetical protein